MPLIPQTKTPAPVRGGGTPAPKYFTKKGQVKVGAGSHLGFAPKKGYYLAPGAPRATPNPALAAAAADPYTGIIAGIPKPLTQAQIMQQAQGQISPLVAAVSGRIGKQTAAETNAIKGFTTDAANKLAAIDWGAPYAQGEQQQASVDSALRQALASGGQADADALSQRLAVINDPTVAAAAGQLSANGAANGNTQLAQGSAALSNLISNQAADTSYGQKQPGIQRLAGLQQIATAGQQAQASIAQQSEALQAQLPSIIQNLQASNDARTSALTAARENQVARQDAIASGAATSAEKQAEANAKAAATTQTNQTRLTIAEMNAQGKASAAQIAQSKSDRSYRLQFAKTFGFDPITNATLPGYKRNANGKVVKVGTTKPGSGGSSLTPSQITKNIQSWHDGKVQNARVPATDKDGNPVYDANGAQVYTTKSGTAGTLTYRQALARLRASGVDQKTALGYLDSAWKRGEGDPQKGGRGWLENAEQDALKKAGLSPRAQVVNGHGVLNAKQVAALKRAGHLPPGQLTAEGAYVIAQVY